MKIELSVLSVYSVLSVSFYLDPCCTGIEIERLLALKRSASLSRLNPCYTGMEIEQLSREVYGEQSVVLILVILEWR